MLLKERKHSSSYYFLIQCAGACPAGWGFGGSSPRGLATKKEIGEGEKGGREGEERSHFLAIFTMYTAKI